MARCWLTVHADASDPSDDPLPREPVRRLERREGSGCAARRSRSLGVANRVPHQGRGLEPLDLKVELSLRTPPARAPGGCQELMPVGFANSSAALGARPAR